jgi:hypothetical protein
MNQSEIVSVRRGSHRQIELPSDPGRLNVTE